MWNRIGKMMGIIERTKNGIRESMGMSLPFIHGGIPALP